MTQSDSLSRLQAMNPGSRILLIAPNHRSRSAAVRLLEDLLQTQNATALILVWKPDQVECWETRFGNTAQVLTCGQFAADSNVREEVRNSPASYVIIDNADLICNAKGAGLWAQAAERRNGETPRYLIGLAGSPENAMKSGLWNEVCPVQG